MVRRSLHGIMVVAAENDADSGGTNLRMKRAIVIESAGVVENAMKWRRELMIELEGGGERVTVRIEDMGVDASVPKALIDTAMEGYLSVDAIRRMATKYKMTALTRWLDEGGEEKLRAMLGQRHAYVHSLSRSMPRDVRASRTADAVLFAVLDGRTIDQAVALIVKGSCMEMAGRAGRARAAYRRALALCRAFRGRGRDAARALVCAGHALAHLGRIDEARESFLKAAREDPDSPVAYFELGNLALLAGRHEDAGRMYSRAIEIDPSYAPARVFRGHALLVREPPGGELAVVEYRGGLALDPYDISAHVGQGLAEAGRGRHAEAAGHFRRAMRIDPDDAAAYVALGHAMAALGRDAEAARAYRTAINMGEGIGHGGVEASRRINTAIRIKYRLGGASAHVGLAGAMSRMGLHEKALRLYAEAASLDGGSAEAHAGAARMLAALGRWNEAIPRYRSAIEIDPRIARAHLGLAEALSDAGRPEEAVPSYRSAIEIDPRSAEAHLGLAEAISKTGMTTEAQWAYERAVKLDPSMKRGRYGAFEGGGA